MFLKVLKGVYTLLEEMHMYYSSQIPPFTFFFFLLWKLRKTLPAYSSTVDQNTWTKIAADQLDLLSNYEAMQAKQAKDPSKG